MNINNPYISYLCRVRESADRELYEIVRLVYGFRE